MNSISIVLITALLCLHYAHASSSAEQEIQNAKEDNDIVKTTIESGGALYLGLNSTILWVAVLGLGALALAAYFFGVSSLFGDESSEYSNQRYTNYYDPDLQAADSPTALAALRYAQEAQAAQQASARSKRAMDESKFYQ